MSERDEIITLFFEETDKIADAVPDDEDLRHNSTVLMTVDTLMMFLAAVRFARSRQTFALKHKDGDESILCHNVSMETLFREYMKKVDQGICPDCNMPLDSHEKNHDNIPPPASFVKH